MLGYSASLSSLGVAPQLDAGSAERRANPQGMSSAATGSGSRSPETNAEGHARPAQVRLTPLDGFSDKETRNERIHDALRVHGYTLQEVGDAVGLHYSTVSRIAKTVASLCVQPADGRRVVGRQLGESAR